MPDQIRVRFAPSPTGYLHVGGARTALFNWLYARKEGGVFVLRIEDTDRERSTDESTRTILDGMMWLGLTWDEGPVHQADGFDRHRVDVMRLLEKDAAYRCFCTPAELAAKREAMGNEYRYDRACYSIPREESDRRAAAGEPFTIRFRVPAGTTEWDDIVHGPTRFDNESIEDFIVLRTDGTPIYNMAVVSDDIDMRITHVIRGDDHLSNTPKQILIYQALGATVPAFGHLPMILGPDGRKLSKRRNAVAVGDYADMGILPQALSNFLALLGWSPGEDRELMSTEEMTELFTLDRILKKGSVFDTEKLLWMNGQYLIHTPAAELMPVIGPLLVAEGLATERDLAEDRGRLEAVVDVLKPRSRTTLELVQKARTYLADEVEEYEADAVAKHWRDPAETAARLQTVREVLMEVDPWEGPALEAALRTAAERTGAGFGKLVHPLRLAVTGSAASPPIDQVLVLLGRERVARRIDAAVESLVTQRT